MKRRAFLQSLAAGSLCVAAFPKVAPAEAAINLGVGEGPVVRIGDGAKKCLCFAQVTDSHFCTLEETDKDYVKLKALLDSRGFDDMPGRYAKVMAQLLSRKAEFVLHTGDCIDRLTTGDLVDFDRACRSLPVETFVALGNHDYTRIDYDEEGALRCRAAHGGDWSKTAAEWKEKVGAFSKRYYAVERGGIRILVLDNASSRFEDEQLAWLDCELSEHAKQPAILAFHIPLYTDELAALLTEAKLPVRYLMPQDSKIYDLLPEHANIKALLTGHLHHNWRSSVAGIPQYVTAATPQGGFRIIECYA